jgi:hypothetical protein
MSRSLSILSLSFALVGCVETAPRPALLFHTGKLKTAQWSQIDKVCEYEAAKAVTPIKHGLIATEQYRKLYILCAESKGAEFIGTNDKQRVSDPGVVEVVPYYYN